MSMLTMPLLITNLGCEMIYILQQRLLAQNIPQEKAVKVLHDVVKAMFETSFVSLLFTPQAPFTVQSTRTIFDKLAHSSIMRLSEASMDKLFDLMMMGVKYQLLACTEASQFLQVTVTHLQLIWKIVQTEVEPHISDLLERVESTYSKLSVGEWGLLQQRLFGFFQDKHVKVSLFLQEGIQTPAGRIILPGPLTSSSCVTPGEVVIFGENGGFTHKEKHTLDAMLTSSEDFLQHPTPLGSDLYDRDRPKVTLAKKTHNSTFQKVGSESSARVVSPSQHQEVQAESSHRPCSLEGKHEANLLASLIRENNGAAKFTNVKINLVLDDGTFNSDHDAGSVAKQANVVPVVANLGAEYHYRDSLLDVAKSVLVPESSTIDQDNDDLLGLLDAAE